MPQARKRSAFAIPVGRGGAMDSSMLQATTESPPTTYAAPHHAKACTRSCLQTNSSNRPSSIVTQVATTNSVPMSNVMRDGEADMAVIAGPFATGAAATD